MLIIGKIFKADLHKNKKSVPMTIEQFQPAIVYFKADGHIFQTSINFFTLTVFSNSIVFIEFTSGASFETASVVTAPNETVSLKSAQPDAVTSYSAPPDTT